MQYLVIFLIVKCIPCLHLSLSCPQTAVKRPRSLQFERGRIFKEHVKIYFQKHMLTIFVDNNQFKSNHNALNHRERKRDLDRKKMEYSQYPEAVNDSITPNGTYDFDADEEGVDVEYVAPPPPPPPPEEAVVEGGEMISDADYDDGEIRELNRRSGKGIYVILALVAACAIAALAVGSTLLVQKNNRDRSIEAAKQEVASRTQPPTPAVAGVPSTSTYSPTFVGTQAGGGGGGPDSDPDLSDLVSDLVSDLEGGSDPTSPSSSSGTTSGGNGTVSDGPSSGGDGAVGNTDGGSGEDEPDVEIVVVDGDILDGGGTVSDGSTGGGSGGQEIGSTSDGSNGGVSSGGDGVDDGDSATSSATGSGSQETDGAASGSGGGDGTTDSTPDGVTDGGSSEETGLPGGSSSESEAGSSDGGVTTDNGSEVGSGGADGGSGDGDSGSGVDNTEDGGDNSTITDPTVIVVATNHSSPTFTPSEAPSEPEGHLGFDGCLKDGEEEVAPICLPDAPIVPRAVNCCSGSMADDSLTCTRGPTCYVAATYSDAVSRCEGMGLRLCTVSELKSGACCNEGCNFDFRVGWTSDACSNDDPSPTPAPSDQTTTNNATAAPTAQANTSNAPTDAATSNATTAAPTTQVTTGNATAAPTSSNIPVPTSNPASDSNETDSPTNIETPTVNPIISSGDPTQKPVDSVVSPPTATPSVPVLNGTTSTGAPTLNVSRVPTQKPVDLVVSPPTPLPSSTKPSASPTIAATESNQPTSTSPTQIPTSLPSDQPTPSPSVSPTSQPTGTPSVLPSAQPTPKPSVHPSTSPTSHPSDSPSNEPTCTISIEVDFVTEEEGSFKETGFTLLSVSGSKSTTYMEVMPGDLEGQDSHNQVACVEEGSYILTVTDDSRKCCGNDRGYYVVKVRGEEVVRGGANFESPEAYIIRTDYKPPTAETSVQWLKEHNDARQTFYEENNVTFAAMVWSDSLVQAAAKRANAIAPTCGSGPANTDPWGENVARTTFVGYNEKYVKPEWVLNGWNDPVNAPWVFRQAMWRPTRYVGCASNITQMYVDGPYCHVAVCKYTRPGNCGIVEETWLNQTLADYSSCGPPCPDDGCH
jgi:hypothetical protein